MSPSPLVTIAVPTRDRAGLLRETLQSALVQTFQDFELVVSDNASSDGTPAVLAGLADPRVRAFRQERTLPMHENWNFCLNRARGKFFLLLSDDDLLLPGALDALLRCFEGGAVKLAYSRALLITHEGKPAGVTLAAPASETGEEFIAASLRGRRQALPCITLHLAQDLRALGGYPEIGNVTDLAVRMALASAGEVRCVPEPQAKYRLNPAGLTADPDRTIESLDLFLEWLNSGPARLNRWGGEAAAFCARWMRERAVSSAIRGEAEAAELFARAAGKYGGSETAARLLARLCSLPPVRALAALRRGSGPAAAAPLVSAAALLGPLILFIVAWGFTGSRVDGGLYYPALLALCAAACSAAAYTMAGRGRAALAGWLALAVMLLAGPVKYFWIVLSPAAPRMFFPAWVWPLFAQKELLLPVFCLQAGAFTALCCCLAAFIAMAGKPAVEGTATGAAAEGKAAAALAAVLPLLAAASFLLVKQFQIGVLGLPPRPLPFRLSGIIFYLQTILLPVLILVQIWLAHKNSRSSLARAGLLLLFIWAGGDALARGSRGSLLLAPLLTVFLAACGGFKLRRGETAFIAGAVLAALLLAPLAVEYRVLRAQGLGLGDTLARLPSGFTSSLPGLFGTAAFFFLRIPGAEMLFAMAGLGAVPLGGAAAGVLLSPEGLPGYLTKTVIGVPYTMSFAPSLAGSGYLLFGYPGVLLFSALAAGLAVFGWTALLRPELKLRPVFQAFFLLLFFWLLTEGLTPIVVKQFFSAAAALLLCEWALRLTAGRKA